MKNSIVWDYFLLINKYTDCQYLSALQMQTSPVYYPQALSLVSCTLHCFSSKAHMKWCLRHRISQPKSVSPQVQGYRITQGTTHSLDVYPGADSIGTYLIRKVPDSGAELAFNAPRTRYVDLMFRWQFLCSDQ